MTEVPARLPPRDSGDAWVEGPDGRRYWGRYGAAGLLVHDEAAGVLLQHRAEWSHFGGTWGLPGGARHAGESAVAGAVREAGEEAGVPADALEIAFTSTVDFGFWSYVTVVARASRPFEATIGDAESLELRWVPVTEVDALPLHPGFEAAWPGLRARLGRRIRLVVDAANVVGSRPDGWWRDRAGAASRLLGRLEALSAAGVAVEALESADGDLAGGRCWAGIVVVLEGQARAAELPVPTAPTGDDMDAVAAPDAPLAETVTEHADGAAAMAPALEVVRAPASGDDTIVAVVEAALAAGSRGADRLVVITADRELVQRVTAAGAETRGPGWLLEQLDALD